MLHASKTPYVCPSPCVQPSRVLCVHFNCWFPLSEQFKDWQVRNEQRERAQEAEDRAEALQRRYEEAQVKKGKKFGGDFIFERYETMFDVV